MTSPSKRRRSLARQKPGPKPQTALLEGRDYYCGTCTGHHTVACPDCLMGCAGCGETGRVTCEQCGGGTIPVPPPRAWDGPA